MPLVDLTLRFLLGYAITFLNFAGEYFGIALGFGQVVVGKLAPLLLHLTLELFPVPRDLIPIHGYVLRLTEEVNDFLRGKFQAAVETLDRALAYLLPKRR
jgi:hypothetical protein